MKKKRAIRDYVLISIFIVLVLLLSFLSFPVPGTNYDFKGLVNLQPGLELDGGVRNTYDLEVADWYKGSKQEVYQDAVNRVQYLLNRKYADARVYLNGDDKITIEVPDTTISDNFVVGLLEMKSESGKDAEAKITGADIEKVEYMQSGTTHGVYLEFNKAGKEKFQNLTKEVSEKDDQLMYIYMNKDYDNPFSQPKVTEENTLGYTFISGTGITNKDTGTDYAYKIESAIIGVNMSTELDEIEILSTYGQSTKITMLVTTIVIVVASLVVGYILFKELGLVSGLSTLFALMVSIIICALFDLQISLYGWLGFLFGYVFNYLLHLYYLNNIKKEYAMGKKFTVSFTSSYKKSLFAMLDTMLISVGLALLLLIVPSNAIRYFSYNFLMTIPGTAFTALLLNKIVTVDYTAFNLKDAQKVNFTREESIDEVK